MTRSHDPLCLNHKLGFAECNCALIRRVRDDERERLLEEMAQRKDWSEQ